MATNKPPSKNASKKDYSEHTDLDEVNTRAALKLSKSIHDQAVLKQNIVAKQSHNVDLFKTQQPSQGNKDGDVLLLINFPDFTKLRSCNGDFVNVTMRMSSKQILDTGSTILKENLESEAYQRRVKQAVEPLPEGIKYVLNISPSTEEDEYSVALQCLSITNGVKLWYRSMAVCNVSPAVVAGHDDACGCNEKWDDPYLMEGPPESIQRPDPITGFNVAACLFDTDSWTVEKYRSIDEFCPVRQAANVVRLFRSIVDNDLLIDSAPRLWTIVGLFGMFGMTNHDLLLDHVTAWFNDSNNMAFIELLPEETIRIATVLKSPALCEAAFRILVNERALIIAGGAPSKSHYTVFGRKISDCLTGTEDMEKILQQIEHAGVHMAERYKRAIDNLCSGHTLSFLGVPEWEQLTELAEFIPADQSFTVSYMKLVALVQVEFRLAIEHIVTYGIATDLRALEKGRNIEAALSYYIPLAELNGDKSFEVVYDTLNKAQRALCLPLWLRLRGMTLANFPNLIGIHRAAISFSKDLETARKQGIISQGQYPAELEEYDANYWSNLFQHAIDKLQSYIDPLISRADMDFHYSLTPHLVLCLNEEELGYCHYEDDTAYEATIPEAEMGPSGPGPAFHTGKTVMGATDSIAEDMENLSINSDDGGANTIVASDLAQDGISTVYNRHRVIAQSSSFASERFTDDSMSADFAEAEAAIPMGSHMMRSQILTLGRIDEDDNYGVSDVESEIEFEMEDSFDDGGDSDEAVDAKDFDDSGVASDANVINDDTIAHTANVANVSNVANSANNATVATDASTNANNGNGVNKANAVNKNEESDEDNDIEVISLPGSDLSGYL